MTNKSQMYSRAFSSSLWDALAPSGGGVSVAALSLAAALAPVISIPAFAQTASTTLPAVKVDAPPEKPRTTAPAKPKPVAVQSRAVRQAAGRQAGVGQHHAAPVGRIAQPAVSASAPGAFLPAGAFGIGPSNVVGYFAGATSTATKTNTPILDIPQSITILTEQQLQDRNSNDLHQALTYVPGVTVTGGEGNKDAVVIRGQNTSADFYRDGVRDDAEYFRDLYNIRAVEVLKGPSALIFGRGGGGGIVNRVTKKADGETIRDIETSFGSFGRKRVTIDFGQAVSDTLAVRLNGLYEHSYGFRNFFELERYGINPTLTWKPQQNTLVALSYEHFHDRRTVDRGVPSVGLGSFIDGLPLGTAAVSLPGYPAFTPNYTFFGDANPSAKEVNHSTADVNIVDLDMQHKTDFGLDIRNHTLYANYQKHYQNTFPEENVLLFEGPPGGQMEIEGYRHNTPRENIFNQTDLVYKFEMTPEIKHTFLAGAEFGHQKSASERNLACFGAAENGFAISCDGGSAAIDVPFFNPTVYNPIAYGDARERRYTDLTTASGYVQDQIAITKHVDVLAGVRFDHFDLKFRAADIPPPPNAEGGSTTEQLEGEVVDTLTGTIRQINNKWSPRLGLVVKPTEQLSFYGAYSRSFLPMSSDQFVVLTRSLSALSPQGFENFELGFKAQITPRLLLTGALYELNRSNQPLTISAFFAATGNTRTRGGELSLVGYVTDEYQVSLGYGHQAARVLSAVQVPDPGDPLLIFAGKVTPNVPRDTFSFWNKYDVSSFFDQAPGVLGVGAGVVYNAKFYPSLDNAVIVPGYARVDAAAYVRLTENVSARLNIENLAGARYFAAATNNNNIMPGAPRSAYITMNARF